jgi:hypothetical protein
MNKNQNYNVKIVKNAPKEKNLKNKNYKQVVNKSISESSDLSNVLNVTGDFDNSIDKKQLEIIKDFVRDARKNIDMKNYKKNEINELIDKESFSKFNFKTKIKFCYSKHEWTFITIREIFAFLIILIATILYYKSLKTEYHLRNIVFYLYFPMDINSLFLCVGSGVLIGIIIFFIYLKIFFVEHLLYIIIIYFIFIYKNHGSTVGYHGLFNAFIFLFVAFFLFCLLVSFHLFYKYIKMKKYSYLIMSIIILLFILFEGNMLRIKKNHDYYCDKWDINLNGTSVNKINKENINDLSCYINKPKGICYINKLMNYFDLTKDQNISCNNRKESEKAIFINSIVDNHGQFKNTKIFGFPYTNKDPQFFLKNQISDGHFGRLVMKNIFDVEKLKPNEIYPETILDFSQNNYGELKINLLKNETLEKERLNIEKNQNNNYIFKNIFMIYSDATSRAHFQRSFPKLSKFIQRFLPYNTGNTMRSYQFNKYHSFYKQTHFNIIPMFYGDSFFSHKGIHSVKYFKENGFITGHVVDMCSKEQYNIVHKQNSMDRNDKREYEEWDHENVAYLCDGNFRNIMKNNFYGRTTVQGSFSSMEKCLYGKTVSEHMINYATQFWEKYANNRKYFRIAFNYGHEKTGAIIKYLDEPLYNMLTGLYKKGLLKDTAVFIVSDHGNQNDGIYDIINSSEWELEKRYPFFFLILWNNDLFKKSGYDINLLKNQDIMITPYDIHDTMIHIIYGEKNTFVINKDDDKRGYSVNNKGASMFKNFDDKNRNCEKYKDDWKEKTFCKCSKK